VGDTEAKGAAAGSVDDEEEEEAAAGTSGFVQLVILVAGL
jgi:hypothetical protein